MLIYSTKIQKERSSPLKKEVTKKNKESRQQEANRKRQDNEQCKVSLSKTGQSENK
jgi:hypothetical protein